MAEERSINPIQHASGFRWKPNPGQQSLALSIPPSVFEVLYGG
ncbi:hypothetical protein [Caudoviricetes sp.]|nr:hypothetical protein [Caudoviricetes sp.]